METFPYVAWRGIVSTVALIVVASLFGSVLARHTAPGGRRQMGPGRARALLVASLLGSVVNIATFMAFARMSIALVLICFYTFPAIVSIMAVPLYGDRIDRFRAAALTLSASGLALVLLAPVLTGGDVTLDPYGVALALVAAVSQATFILISGRGYAPLPPWRVATVFVFVAGAVAAALAIVTLDFDGLAAPFREPEGWVWIVVGGLIGGAIPTTAFMFGIGIIGPTRAAILMTIEPVIGVLLAGVLLGEQPSPLQLLGGAAVVVAAAALQIAPRRRVEPEPEFGPLI